jgi:hypothetical protein
MRKVIKFDIDEVLPQHAEILESQGMAARPNLPEKIHRLVDSARDLYSHLVDPKGILEDLSISDFQAIYDGNGENASESPLQHIFPRADRLALFAATLGNRLAEKNSTLFAEGEAALGYMLDVVTTCGAEYLAELMGLRYFELMPEEQRRSSELGILHYCPGYCGWDITGQAKIFQTLNPHEIGVTLNESCVMQPLKSVSGVLLVGKKGIHMFKPEYPFCKKCETHKCLERMAYIEKEF